MIKLIIFDLDGTLVNAYPAVSQSVNYTLSALGFKKKSHACVKASVGWGDRHLMAGFVGEELADKAIALYRPHHARALKAQGGVSFLKGAKPLLVRLKEQGFLLGIATNRPSRFTLLILKTLGVRSCFDTVLCADQVSRPKPHPDMLLAILKKHKVDRRQALYVGDMTIDVQTGRRAKIRTVAVTTGSSSEEELKALKPYRIINRIGELKTIISGLPLSAACTSSNK